MATLAVFAFVAPPITLAFATPGTVYCLTHDDHGMGLSHQDHAVVPHNSGALDHTKHSHQEGEHKYHCCGLFCVIALAPEAREFLAPLLLRPEHSSISDPGFHSRAPELPFRPPILSLSL
jgi:hypothetical protein